MNNVKNYFIHLFILCLIQIIILNNIDLGSYFYLNIYILAIYILPYRFNGVSLLVFGFLLGMFMDFASHSVGIHAAATTFVAYIRTRLLLLTSNREELEEVYGILQIKDFGWFFKYVLLSTLLFNTVLVFAEAFTFHNILLSFTRVILSSVASLLVILLYYFIGLRKIEKRF